MPVAALSGGEKNRLMLAVALAKKSNFLVLDEPTNDLDMDTLDLLQEVLSDYEGTIILVSHDRDFLDRVITSVIYMPGDGTAVEYAGSYSDLLAKLKDKKVSSISRKDSVKAKKEPTAVKKMVKLSYNQQRLLNVLPQEIKELEQELETIKSALGDSCLYTDNPDKFNALTARYDEITKSITDKETQWLEIETIREKLEQE